MTVELRVLGEVEVRIDGRPVPLGHARQRCVLAALAFDAGHRVSIDQLIDRVWGERTPGDARNVLYSYLAKLRRALAGTQELVIESRPGGYRLIVDSLAVDLHRFHHLLERARAATDDKAASLFAQALALWRGEPFAGLDTPWLDTVRTAMVQERTAAELDQIDLRLRHGEHAALVADLLARTSAHPLHERIAGQYMLALYRSGRAAEALTHYHHTRHHLADELGVDPGPALRELHEQILRNDPQLRLAPPPESPVRPPIPQQLPAHAPHFVGRAAELRQLTTMLDNATTDTGGTVMISAIGGAGGIGKTWLALHWAHQHLDRFPDGQVFVDLRGFTAVGGPMTPQTAVRGLLDGLGVDPQRIPGDLDAQIGLYRSTVAGKRMLIMLDNAADAGQVTPLLPGSPTCTVVITSRRYLPSLVTAHHAYHVPLDVLTETEARHLLTARLGAERVAADGEAVETLLDCCAGFPLALGIVIGRALAHPDFPLSVLAAELADATSAMGALDDLDAAASLPAVLSWSVRACDREQARVFALLGIAPGPDISLPAAASLTALPLPQARKVLRELEHASLVQQDTPERYRMHDLIRLYATETAADDLADDVREAALRRVLDFYTQAGYAANRLLDPHRQPIRLDPPVPGVQLLSLPDDRAAMTWFDTEHPTLLAAQQTAVGHAWHATVWQLAWTQTTFQARRGHRDDMLAVWRAAVDAAAHMPDPAARVTAHRLLGRACAALGRHDEGIGHLHQALVLAEEHHDLDQQARIHRVLAWAWERRGDNRQALTHAARARDLFHALDQPVWEADALNAVGWLAALLGDYPSARTHCQAALTLHRDQPYPEGEADTLDSLGYIDHHTGRHRQAVDHYQQAISLYRVLGYTDKVPAALDALGHPHVALGEREQAHLVWREAAELYRQQGRDADADRVRRQLDTLDHAGD